MNAVNCGNQSGDAISVREATRPEELEAIFRFRYRIYVEEMNRAQHDADHGRKRIEDFLDEDGINIAAWRNDEVIGVVRLNLSRHGDVGYYEELYQMRAIGAAHPTDTSICTRLMIIPGLRRSRLAVRLCSACFVTALDNGVAWNYIDCNDHLVPYFTGLGYRFYIGPVVHKEYGQVYPLRLDLRDLAHLERIGSPLLAVARRWQQGAGAETMPAAAIPATALTQPEIAGQ